MALPTFSGLRKDWPEFKAVWKSMAESASYNKTALAHELKNSVKGEAKLVDEVESAYSQLEELNQLNTLTMRDVDNLTDLLPTHLKVDWRRKYRDLSSAEKLQPFTPLMKFLERERSVVARLAENRHSKKEEMTMQEDTAKPIMLKEVQNTDKEPTTSVPSPPTEKTP